MTALEIIKKVLKEHAVTFQDKTSGMRGGERDFCVQYGESAFHFLCRLMEEEGLFYFFTHTSLGHTLVLASDNKVFHSLGTFPLARATSGGHVLGRRVWDLSLTQHIRPNQIRLNDYAPKKPTQNLYVQEGRRWDIPLSIYDYPGGFGERNKAERLGKRRLEAEACLQNVLEVKTGIPQLSPAHSFGIEGVDGAFKGEKIILSIFHRYGIDGSGQVVFQNTVRALPESLPYRPLEKTPKPLAHPETATVVGAPQEDIHTNPEGCIKVKFHWDCEKERGGKDEDRSGWIRVASPWAGAGWGMVYTPRVGQEVVVAFLNRNPDRPLVIGSVYNGLHPLPYGGHPKHSGIRSRSTPQGNAENFNEFMFDDERGKEKLSLQAEKDAVVKVKDSLTTTVQKGVMQTVLECGDRKVTLQGKEGGTQGKGDDFLTLEKGSREVILKGTGAHLKTSIASGKYEVKIQKGTHETVIHSGDHIISLKQGKQEITVSGGGYTLKVTGGDVSIQTTGKIKLSGREVEIKGQSGLSFSTMGKISMDCTEFSLNAKTRASLSASLQLALEGKARASLKGAMVDISGQALAKVNGALVTLN
jgi:type VI secretion system secreted protein VgrG